MPHSGCSALYGVNLNFEKMLLGLKSKILGQYNRKPQHFWKKKTAIWIELLTGQISLKRFYYSAFLSVGFSVPSQFSSLKLWLLARKNLCKNFCCIVFICSLSVPQIFKILTEFLTIFFVFCCVMSFQANRAPVVESETHF